LFPPIHDLFLLKYTLWGISCKVYYFSVIVSGGLTYQWTISKKSGHPKLLLNGFGYGMNKGANRAPYWQCDKRKFHCPARVVLGNNGQLEPRGEHNHYPDQQEF